MGRSSPDIGDLPENRFEKFAAVSGKTLSGAQDSTKEVTRYVIAGHRASCATLD
jgi:hypothetical protein